MRNNRNHVILIFILYFIISFLPIYFSNETVRKVIFINYLIQLIFCLVFAFIDENKFKIIVSPSFLAVLYINVNFLIGSWAYNNGLILYREWIAEYFSMDYLHLSTFYFNMTNFVILIAYFVAKNIKLVKIKFLKISMRQGNDIVLTIMAILTLIGFFNSKIDLSLIGGVGNFSIIPKTIAALIIIIMLSRKKYRFRYIFYFLLLLVFVSFSFHDKREAIFLIFPIFLLEFYNKRFVLKFKSAFLIILIGTIAIFFIILMSITRGYGRFGVDSVWASTRYVDDYLKHEKFVKFFMNNIEVSSTFLHSNLAINYILEDISLMTYGSTIIKFIFIPIPRKIYPNKPDSMAHLFTNKIDPSFREMGGSYPVTIQSEMFWNFHFFGLIPLFFIFIISNYLFRLLVNVIEKNSVIDYLSLLFGYTIFMYIVRGNGIDAFFVYFILGYLFSLVFRLLYVVICNVK